MKQFAHRFSSFLKHLQRSQSRYSIHSPFVYQLLEEGLRKTPPKENFINEIEAVRKDMLKSTESIIKTDYGAGGLKDRNYTVAIKKIASHSLQGQKSCLRLLALAKFLEAKSVLELGTSLGITSLYLAKGLENSNITTIEGCSETAKIAQNNFNRLEAHNIKLIVSPFDEAINNRIDENQSFDLIYIDGNHQQEPTIRYFNSLMKYSHNNSVFIFDDIHWSKGMSDAWSHIIRDKRIRISLDFYTFGLVFFRQENQKQDFSIRL